MHGSQPTEQPYGLAAPKVASLRNAPKRKPRPTRGITLPHQSKGALALLMTCDRYRHTPQQPSSLRLGRVCYSKMGHRRRSREGNTSDCYNDHRDDGICIDRIYGASGRLTRGNSFNSFPFERELTEGSCLKFKVTRA